MEKIISLPVSDPPVEPFPVDPEIKWELFDFVKKSLLEDTKRKSNADRDLLIFMLYTWSNFSANEVKKLACLSDIGDRVVDLVVNRGREKLNKNNADERI